MSFTVLLNRRPKNAASSYPTAWSHGEPGPQTRPVRSHGRRRAPRLLRRRPAQGTAERYVREWLNSQAAAGYLSYHADTGTYELGPEEAEVLANPESPVYMPPAWEIPASMWSDEEQTLDAFRTGRGIPWGAHDERLFCGVAAFYRNGYRSQLVPQWISALEGVEERLRRGGRVCDVGCGHGISTVLMAEAYPHSSFWGVDAHPASVEAARARAEERGVEDRVTFQVGTGQTYKMRDLDLVLRPRPVRGGRIRPRCPGG